MDFRFAAFWPLILLGNLLAIGLGLAAAFLASVSGPALLGLLGPDLAGLPATSGLTLFPSSLKHLAQLLGFSLTTLQEDLLAFGIPAILFGAATIKAGLTFLHWSLWEWIGERWAYDARNSLATDLLQMDPKLRYIGVAAEGRVSAAMTQDLRRFQDYVVHFYGGLPREGLQVLFTGILLVILSPKLFGIFTLALLPLGFLVKKLGRRLRRRAKEALHENSTLSEWIEDRLLGIATIKHAKTEGQEISAMAKFAEQLKEKFLRAARLKARTGPLMEFAAVLGLALVLVAIGSLGAFSSDKAQDTLSFFVSLGLFGQSAARLARYFNSNREGKAAAHHLGEIAGELRQHHRPQPLIKVLSQTKELDAISHLLVKDVSFSFKAQKTNTLENFSATFDCGKIYGLKAPSGGGKTTLLEILVGLKTSSTGTVSFMVQGDRPPLHKLLAYVPQHPPLMARTVWEHVIYPLEACDTAEVTKVQEALRMAHADGFVSELPQGIHTPLGADGRDLSGGQIQRLHLARVAFHRPMFIFLDEPTSALDKNSEKECLSFLQRLAKDGHCIVMSAHRPAALDMCDEIITLASGTP